MSAKPTVRPKRKVHEISAGGFVLANDGSGRVALIARKNRAGRIDWCVPKGHPEGSEDYREAAIREVFEETGLVAEIIEPLGDINYEFNAGTKIIEKTVYHFLMRQTGGELNIENDPHHEACDAGWFTVDELERKLSHENEKRLARGVLEWVERHP